MYSQPVLSTYYFTKKDQETDYISLLQVTFLQTQYRTVFTVFEKLLKNITILLNLFNVI